MDPSTLADRLRAIVQSDKVRPGGETPEHSATPPSKNPAADPGANRSVQEAERVLGGDWRHREGLSCFVVERRQAPETRYGGDVVAAIARRLADAEGEAALVMRGAQARPPFLFFDLETTGLSGGAGTYAFLVGCGAFDADGGFRTRQFVLLRHADERQLLQTVGGEMTKAGALVTFNGKSFDAPLIEMRYLFHRLDWTGGALPHLDVLHPARRFWSDGDARCSLQALEWAVLGARRTGDVPGSEIPARYFQFIRTGDARPLGAVLEHNRLDLLSLAGLTARLLDLVRRGPSVARHPREALALGRVYGRGGLDSRAREAYQHACATVSTADAGTACTDASLASIEASTASTEASLVSAEASMASIKIAGLRELALLSRRARQYDEAAVYWRELLEIPSCPQQMAREASQALAVHHEHRVRDLPAARAFALRTFDARKPAWNQAVQYRLARIDRKISERLKLFPS
jgi:uncharacterized protein YprB with RNaseH-like and TPR domain